jgi:hypothetical protein
MMRGKAYYNAREHLESDDCSMGVPEPTEMTVRSLLLRELEKRGVKVNPEVSFVTLFGARQLGGRERKIKN